MQTTAVAVKANITDKTWPASEYMTAIDALIAAINSPLVARTPGRIVIGDSSSQDARIYIMPLDTNAMTACVKDTKMYTQVNANADLRKNYLAHLRTIFGIQNSMTIKLGAVRKPLDEIVNHLQTMVKTLKADHVLFANNACGFNLYFVKAGILVQFYHPRNRIHF